MHCMLNNFVENPPENSSNIFHCLPQGHQGEIHICWWQCKEGNSELILYTEEHKHMISAIMFNWTVQWNGMVEWNTGMQPF